MSAVAIALLVTQCAVTNLLHGTDVHAEEQRRVVLVDDGTAIAADSPEVADLRRRLIERVRAVMDRPVPLVARFRIEHLAMDEDNRVLEGQLTAAGASAGILQYLDGRWRITSDSGRVRVSDGELLWDLDPRSRVAYVSSSINHPSEALLEIAIQREGFWGWSAVPTFAAALEEAEFVSIEEAGDAIHAVYEIPREGTVLPRRFRYEITVHDNPTRIDSFRVVAPARDGGPGWHRPTIYESREWTALGGRPIARVADRWRPGSDVASRFTLVDARVPTPEETDGWIFAGPREPGWRVFDDRLRLEWVIGERVVTVAGQRFRLAEPLVDHPGDRLAELLATAERFDEGER